MATLYDNCDIILNDVSSREDKRFDTVNGRHIPYFEKLGIQSHQLHQALTHLVEDGHFTHSKLAYDLTPKGEEFNKQGGYAGKKKRDEADELATLSSKQLEHYVFRSNLETNSSVVETNKSIQKLNNYTIKSLRDQRITTYISLGIAALAIILSILQLILN